MMEFKDDNYGECDDTIRLVLNSTRRRILRSASRTLDNNYESVDDAAENLRLTKMAPRPNGDLFIEPAGDYDVIYGDYNSTMEDGSGKRPYLRLTSRLPNVTRPAGGEVRLKCEVAGAPLPIHFAWLKNLAPLEKHPRFRVRNKDYWSKLVISNLEVLDSGYYQCTASNAAGSTNSTAVLRVTPSSSTSLTSSASFSAPNSASGSRRKAVAKGGSRGGTFLKNADFNDYYNYDNNKDYPDEMKGDENFLLDVPKTAGGAGFAPVASDRWLENRALHKGECILYQGASCSQFLAGKHVKINTENREDIYDIDRHLTAAMLFIKNMPNVSGTCKRYSHAVACYHLFKVCDRPTLSYESPRADASASNEVVSICKQDCDIIQTKECPNEFAMAAQHELVGDGPKALLPRCDALPANAQKCIRVLEPAAPIFPPPYANENIYPTRSSASSALCFDGDGRNYEGLISRTKSQRQCLEWPQSTSTQFNTNVYPRLKHAKNHCRNPDGRRAEPFCYTAPLSSASGAVMVEEACDIPRCQLSNEILHYPRSEVPNGAQPSSLLDSLNNVWRSMSPEQWQLFAALGIGAATMLLFFLLCFLCCCCCRRGAQRRGKSSTVGSCGVAGSSSGMNAESASSMISGAKKNGNFLRVSGGGSSTANSEVNNAYLHKMCEERMRNGACGDSDVLKPLLNSSDQFAQQQQMFELQPQQNYRWVGNGASSVTGSMQYPPHQLHHSLPHQQQQQLQYPNAPTYPQQQPQHFMVAGGNNLSGSPHTSTEPPAEPYQIPTIQEHQLQFDSRGIVGEDASTTLYLGEWTGSLISGNSLHVAIKAAKPGAGKIAIENFRDEIKEIGPFEHINVLRLFGVTYLSQQNISAVFDYMVHGDLHEFLKVREPRSNKSEEEEYLRNAEDFLRISTQIISGMEYLASFSYVHRDLAARNCLVGDQLVVKISDFARLKPNYDNDYYRINQGLKIPLRWLSREAFNEGKYSQASDVYAFGVTLWEIYTYGRQPYDGYSDQKVIEMLNDDLTLEAPQFCPPIIYGVIMNCTNADSKRRPTFAELHPRFQKWCNTGQTQALLPGGRASSVHSGSSGSAAMQRTCRQIAPPVNSYTTSTTTTNNSTGISTSMLRGSMGLAPFGLGSGAGGSVPSPAPNSALGSAVDNQKNGSSSGSGQMTAKLTMLSSNTIVHSTPIAKTMNADKPLNRNYPYSEGEDDEYSSNDS